jgi:hypothetical protein
MESDASEEKCKETAGFYVNIFLQKDEYLQCQQPKIASYYPWAIVVKLLNIRVPEQFSGRPKRSRSRKNAARTFLVPLIQQSKSNTVGLGQFR